MVKEKVKEVQGDLVESAHKIWLAGLGALAVAEEEGSKLFQTLLERGQTVESKGREQVGKAKETVAGIKTVAESYWQTLEQRVDEQVTKVIHRLGVPTKEEIETLTKRVEDLADSIEKLRAQQKQSKGTGKATTKKTTGA